MDMDNTVVTKGGKRVSGGVRQNRGINGNRKILN